MVEALHSIGAKRVALNAVYHWPDWRHGSSNMARTGWHQDASVIVEEADNTPMLTVWVAITDATPEMGCMQAIPGSHRWPTLSMHCPGRSGVGEIFIPQHIVDQPVGYKVSTVGNEVF